MNKRIYLSPPHMSGEEIKLVQQAFDLNWVAPAGPSITSFEKAIAQYTRVKACLAVNSGTAAIHLALVVLGIGQDDEVICPTFTFSGSCYPVLYQAAKPVFIDAELDTWNLDPELLEVAIKDRIRRGKRPKAIIIVHLFGMPAKVNEIKAIARKYEIPLIEDAAEALGSTYQGEKVGGLADLGIYSFNGNKIITTSGGGALVSNNAEWVEKARYFANQSRSPVPYYHHEDIGYNYQLSNICASIGLGQISFIEDRLKRRREIFDFYKTNLPRDIFSFQPEASGAISNRWLTTAIISAQAGFDYEQLRVHLEGYNIESRPLWKPMHLQPVFKGAPSYLNGNSESLFNSGLCLPSGSGLSDTDLAYITDKMGAF
jgi:dTDP-4-amino-4,6-dideoxygalactose transaminase